MRVKAPGFKEALKFGEIVGEKDGEKLEFSAENPQLSAIADLVALEFREIGLSKTIPATLDNSVACGCYAEFRIKLMEVFGVTPEKRKEVEEAEKNL